MTDRSETKVRQRLAINSLMLFVMAVFGLLVVLSVASGHAGANENRGEENPLVNHLMEVRGINRAEAEKRIAWQDRASDLYDELERHIPVKHGGVWIGENDDRVKVGIVDGNKSLAATLIATKVDGLSLQDAVDYIPVERAMSELESTVDTLTAMPSSYDEQNKEWQIQIGVTPSRNKVSLSLPPKSVKLTEKQQQFVSDAEEKFGAAVEIEHYPSKPVDFTCSDQYCNRPLRGGVRINPFIGDPCTAGFIVRGKATGRHYVMTAGHCSQSGGAGTTGGAWLSNEATAGSRTIGNVTENSYRNNGVDGMIIRVRTDQSWNWSTRGWIYIRDGVGNGGFSGPSRNTQWYINGHSGSGSLEGQRICVAGAFYRSTPSGPVRSSCGPVKEVGVAVTINGVRTTGNIRAHYCATFGDSGGPVVRGATHNAIGIIKGSTAGVGCHQWMYYTGVISVINSLDGRIEIVTN